MSVKTLNAPGATSGDAQQLLPDRGKGLKRTVIIHVYNAANVTAFIAHDKQTLLEPLSVADASLGQQAGIPIGKNGAAGPFIVVDWEGPMWAVGSVAGVQVCVEEGFA